MKKSKGSKFWVYLIGAFLLIGLVFNSQKDSENSDEPVASPAPSETVEAPVEEPTEEPSPSEEPEEEVGEPDVEDVVDAGDPASLPQFEAHFIDVGQADAALLTFDEHNILIDAGDWRGNEVTPYLQELGVSELDLVVGSHPHADHIGQLDKVLEEFSVREVWMNGNSASSKIFERVYEGIDASGADYYEPRAGETFQIGDANIEVLHPNSLTGDLNNDSIVMRITYGEVSLLFTGDAETATESLLAGSNANLSSTILKVGHHGSDTSSTEPFVEKVNPEVAIMSVADNSQYNHPNKTVVDRYNSLGIDLYATKTHGTVLVTTDGAEYSVSTQRDGTVTPGD